MEAGKWIFELCRIASETSILACPPYFMLRLISYPPLCCERKKWVMRLTLGNRTNNSEVADCTAPSLTAF